jgi:hypothetical protein
VQVAAGSISSTCSSRGVGTCHGRTTVIPVTRSIVAYALLSLFHFGNSGEVMSYVTVLTITIW